MYEEEELENELVWSDFSLTTIIIAIQQKYFQKFKCDLNRLNVDKLCIISEFEWSFYLEA